MIIEGVKVEILERKELKELVSADVFEDVKNGVNVKVGDELLLGYHFVKDRRVDEWFYFPYVLRVNREKKVYVGRVIKIIRLFLGLFLKGWPVVTAVEKEDKSANKLNRLLFGEGVEGLEVEGKKLVVYGNKREWVCMFRKKLKGEVNE